jgi:hypothetical protein
MIRSCGFATSDQAGRAAEELRQALLLAGAKNVRGVKLYDVEIVEESTPLVLFSRPDLSIAQPPDLFARQLTDFVRKPPLKTHERVAAELINDISFQPSSETRFLLGIVAIETLCIPYRRKGEKNSQRCKRVIRRFLKNKTRAGDFAKLYKKRNDFVHEGGGKGALDNEAAEARQIATDLLLAHI